MDKHNFKKILKKVEKPARYLGNEINSIHTDTTNKDNVLDYKGFKYTKGFWTVNYFRNILNQDDVYNYTKDDKDAKVRQRLNMLINDQNSLMYGRYFIITFRSQYKFKLEAVSITTNTYN